MTQETKAGEPVGEVIDHHTACMLDENNPLPYGTLLYTAPPDTEALRQRVASLEFAFELNDKYWKGAIEQNEALRQRVTELNDANEHHRNLARISRDNELKSQQVIATQAEQIQHLQMALADTEALELGTSERCQRQAEQIKVARDALEYYALGGKTDSKTAVEAIAKLGEQ